jgi:hypothetical protein
MTVDEMVSLGLEPQTAEVINQERQRRWRIQIYYGCKKAHWNSFYRFRHLT